MSGRTFILKVQIYHLFHVICIFSKSVEGHIEQNRSKDLQPESSGKETTFLRAEK